MIEAGCGCQIDASGRTFVDHCVCPPECACDDEWIDCDIHVRCDTDCRAPQRPTTSAEFEAAWQHWRNHEVTGGCSHGR
jgi:hypothetical protein